MTKLLYVGHRADKLKRHFRLLERENWQVKKIDNTNRARRWLADNQPPVALVHETFGVRTNWLCESLMRSNNTVILILDGVEPHRTPANIVLSWPFTPKRLLNSIEYKPLPRTLEAAGLRLDITNKTVQNGGAPVHLNPKELELMAYLMLHAGKPLSRRDIMRQVWQTDYLADTRTLDVHIRWLRQKVEADPSRPRHIRTVRSVGYVLMEGI